MKIMGIEPTVSVVVIHNNVIKIMLPWHRLFLARRGFPDDGYIYYTFTYAYYNDIAAAKERKSR